MKVWILLRDVGHDGERDICGVFTNEERARSIQKEYSALHLEEWDVNTFTWDAEP